MAKGTIAKKKKAPSLHSRAARRATSPGIDTDKSLKNVQPPPESVDHRPSILAIHHGAGVSKKEKKGRAMSSKARKRHEKAQDRAAAIMERTEKKVALSKDQSRAIQSRRKVWDDINQNIVPSKNDKAGPKGTASRDEDGTDESEFDDEMGETGGERENQRGDVDNINMTRPGTETMVDQDDHDGIL
ncbi:Alb1-domain-containing protein [Xylaria cf. heliscus]|nr:Alb1-domain-containing protein [Xylaria cf. heliscus]